MVWGLNFARVARQMCSIMDGATMEIEWALIAEATHTLQQQESKHPKGWLGPWIAESYVTRVIH